MRRGDRRQALQHAVANVLAESTSVEQALPELLRVVTTVLEGQVGLFWLVQEDQSAVRCLHEWFPAGAAVDIAVPPTEAAPTVDDTPAEKTEE